MPSPAHPAPSAPARALNGAALEHFLDDIFESLDQQEAAEVAPDVQQASLRGLLQGQPLQADTLHTVVRLSQLWTLAGKPAQAVRVVEEDGARVRAGLPADEQPEADFDLACWRLHALDGDTSPAGRAALAEGLAALEQRLAAQPRATQSDTHWESLAILARRAGQHACERRCAQARHALASGQPERAAVRPLDDATLALRLGDTFTREGQADAARQAGQQAFAALAQAAPDQDVDHEDWLRLGPELLALDATLAPELSARVLASLPADTAAGPRRAVQVQLHRLQARALQAQGRIEAALEQALRGHHALDSDGDDGFSVERMDWLLAAGQEAPAAALAYQSIANERPTSSEHALRLAQARVQSADVLSPWWPLVLAKAALQSDARQVCGKEAPAQFLARQVAHAQALAAAWPADERASLDAAVAALQGELALQKGRDLPAAVTLLEFATRHPEHASSDNVELLWRARLRLHCPAEALRLPFVPCTAGSWNYRFGTLLAFHLEEQMPKGQAWPKAEALALAARHFALGMAQFEAFFASGQGHFKDGEVHVYSMLCNNYSIALRGTLQTPEQAVAELVPLHRKGIAASPFSEHYDAILRCYRKAQDDAPTVDAAEALWHFAADHGYGRHSPHDYIGDVALALRRLGRDLEIGLWLQRLQSWWDSLDADEQASCRGYHTEIVLYLLSLQAYTQPGDVLPRVRALLPAVEPIGNAEATRLAAVALQRCAEPAEALRLYRLGLTQLQPGNERDQDVEPGLHDGIAECSKLLRPWWRFW